MYQYNNDLEGLNKMLHCIMPSLVLSSQESVSWSKPGKRCTVDMCGGKVDKGYYCSLWDIRASIYNTIEQSLFIPVLLCSSWENKVVDPGDVYSIWYFHTMAEAIAEVLFDAWKRSTTPEEQRMALGLKIKVIDTSRC
ncbi:MAG: hypothetical protein P857_752 [Candidatus Xenolissoclinum pacificiensis L6]|uniref:Uncharacterized protein n=1 Tax=Candidatus Xenolissoclinum pacificiensis L6 TaxID=1401685 RepID=W2V1F4_9RICK|nr:MAG: hypothetical protein P857_752 [Candidatus Xenolissoclinum pacificiensis L6]